MKGEDVSLSHLSIGIIPKIPLVVNGRLIEEVAGIMNQDIEDNGEVLEEDFIR